MKRGRRMRMAGMMMVVVVVTVVVMMALMVMVVIAHKQCYNITYREAPGA